MSCRDLSQSILGENASLFTQVVCIKVHSKAFRWNNFNEFNSWVHLLISIISKKKIKSFSKEVDLQLIETLLLILKRKQFSWTLHRLPKTQCTHHRDESFKNSAKIIDSINELSIDASSFLHSLLIFHSNKLFPIERRSCWNHYSRINATRRWL